MEGCVARVLVRGSLPRRFSPLVEKRLQLFAHGGRYKTVNGVWSPEERPLALRKEGHDSHVAMQPYEVSNFPETPGDLNFPPFFHSGDRRLNFCKEKCRFSAISPTIFPPFFSERPVFHPFFHPFFQPF